MKIIVFLEKLGSSKGKLCFDRKTVDADVSLNSNAPKVHKFVYLTKGLKNSMTNICKPLNKNTGFSKTDVS